jgi:hypothetical protein
MVVNNTSLCWIPNNTLFFMGIWKLRTDMRERDYVDGVFSQEWLRLQLEIEHVNGDYECCVNSSPPLAGMSPFYSARGHNRSGPEKSWTDPTLGAHDGCLPLALLA